MILVLFKSKKGIVFFKNIDFLRIKDKLWKFFELKKIKEIIKLVRIVFYFSR